MNMGRWDAMGWDKDGMRWLGGDGMGRRDGMGWDGMEGKGRKGWNEMRWNGIE